jgi:hypothetical protein
MQNVMCIRQSRSNMEFSVTVNVSRKYLVMSYNRNITFMYMNVQESVVDFSFLP